VTLTRVFNPAIMTWAAMWAIAFSVVGKLGAVLQTIPTPVMGGILVLYQGAPIMTHRDGFPRFSARSAWRGDAGHRKARATPSESLGKPPFRSPGRTAGGRRKALPMSHIARGFPPTRRIAHAISMSHYRRSLV
jgi:hypothetical protein